MEKKETITFNTLVSACLFVIASIMLAFALSFTQKVMIPFVFALFLSYFVSPVAQKIKTVLKVPHWLAILLAFSIFGLVGFSFVMILRGSIIHIIEGFSVYREKVEKLAEDIVTYAAYFEIKLDRESILLRLKDLPVFSFVQSAAGTAVSFIVDVLLVTVFLLFIVIGDKGEKKTDFREEIDSKIRGYILTKVATSFITALLTWVVYALFGLDLALMFSLLCFLLCFIPTLGSIIAVLLPLPIALIQYEDRISILWILLIPAAIQLAIGNIIEPKLMGKGLDLHPITVLISLMFWGLIWGIGGVFLAVPITAVLKIVLEKIPLTYKVSRLLAGQSPF